MASLPQVFSHLYTISSFLINVILMELSIQIRSLTKLSSNKSKNKATQLYFKLIEDTNPTKTFAAKLEGHQSSTTECAVCLSEVVEGQIIRKLRCKHEFHRDCLDKWLQRYYLATCPLCRTKVLPDDVVANNYQRLENYQVEYDGLEEDQMIFFLLSFLGNSDHPR